MTLVINNVLRTIWRSDIQVLTDHTAMRLHSHNEDQLCYEERNTEVDVDVVPHAP